MSEKELSILIKGCLKGEEKSYKCLYEHYYPAMILVCRRYVSNSEEARDVIQEGFIKAFKNLGQFDFHGSFEGWLRKIMVYTALNNYQKFHNKKHLTLVEPNSLRRLEDSRSEGNFQMNGYEVLKYRDVLRAVSSLPVMYRTVFNLNVMEGYSHKEISHLLSISESASRSNLTRAKAILREALEVKGN